MPSYKLRYFPIRGRGEVPRYLFALSGTKFEDERIPMDKWQAHKSEMPFGQLPVLEVDGVAIGQSVAISRYLARQFGYAGKTAIEEALVDSIVDQFSDFFNEILPYFKVAAGFAQGDKDKLYADVVVPARDKFFVFVHNFLKKSGSGYLVGAGLTFADLFFAEHVMTFEGFHPGYAKDFKEVTDLVEKVKSTPALKTYMASRPVTPF